LCDLYQQAPELHRQGVHVVSTDEKTGMQALERLHPSKPMRPGQPEKREFEYRRHGTRTLIATLEVATGKLVAPSLGATRKTDDFIAHVAGVVATDPDAEWVFVLDNLDTHRSHALVDWVAQTCHLADEVAELRKQEQLKTKALRADFLAAPSHRIRFVYTPKHCSWLNQIELWFGTLARAILRRGSFVSVDALTNAILAFIRYYNQIKARPYNWTYTGRPVGL
jgi:DDE superfamily endonuclease